MIATDIDTGKLDSLKAESGGKITIRRLRRDEEGRDQFLCRRDRRGRRVALVPTSCVTAQFSATAAESNSDFAFELNLRGAYRMIRAFLPRC